MSEVAEKTAEIVADQVEDAIDGVVEVVEIFRNNPVALCVAGAFGLVAGVVGGYFIAQKMLRKEFEQLATEEIADAKSFYAGLYKVDENGDDVTPQAVFEQKHGLEAAEALRTYQGVDEVDIVGEPFDEVRDEEQLQKMEKRIRKEKVTTPLEDTIVTTEVIEKTERVNVFADDTFDLKEEMQYRTEDTPYIITQDEYFSAEKDYEQSSLTYYETDDTLVDEHDKPLENVEAIVGEDHLVRFGSGSKDKNIVFVRNDKLEIDYEIIKSPGSYLEEVLGMPEEEPGSLKHSDDRDRRRAFRHGDE